MDLVAAKRARRLFLEKQEKRRLLQEALGAAEHSCARKALLVYKDAEKEYPWDWELRADLWHLQMKLSRFQEALASARLVTRVQPTYAKGHLMKGRALMELRRYPEAVEAFALGLEYHPSGPALIAHFKEAKKQLVGFKRPTRRTNASRKEKKPPVEPTPSYPVLCNRFAPRKEGDGNLKLVCTTVEVKELLRGLPEELLQKLGALKHRELARGLLIDPTAKEPTDEGPPKTLAETHKLPHYAPCINLVHYFGLGRQFITDLYGSDEAGSYLSEVLYTF
jgi:tetratricopeptide (TPR) repeat protein